MACGNLTFQTLSEVFTASMFRRIIREDDSAQFNKCISRSQSLLSIRKGASNLDVIKRAYECLNEHYRSEYLYKNALFSSLVKGKKLTSTVVLNELRVNQSIADTVFINGEAVLYEIKTELDNPDKLIGQISDYKKAFGKICVVTHYSNFYPYYQIIKGTGVGLFLLNDKYELVEHTKPDTKVDDFDHVVLFKLLRKSEYSALIKKKFGILPDVPNTLFFKTCLEIVKNIPTIEFQALVMTELKTRSVKELNCINRIPSELQYICYSLDLKKNEYLNLSGFLKVTFNS